MPDPGRRRLNSWKEVSAYLERDVRTVARWEKVRGLPVRRLPGGGRSVFAYTDEIDAWLAGGGADEPSGDLTADADSGRLSSTAAPDPEPARIPAWRQLRMRWAVVLVLFAVLAGLIAAAAPRLWRRPAAISSVDVRGADLVAFGPAGTEVWRHPFPERVTILKTTPGIAVVDLDDDGSMEVIAALQKSTPVPRDIDDEALYAFDRDGRLSWERRVTDVVIYRAGRYAPPWSSGPVTTLRLNGQSRILWSVHHHTWWPAIVAMFDPAGREVSRFRHAGWITSMATTTGGIAILTGFSNHDDADVVAVLDAESWPGAGPPATGTSFDCLDCPAGRPLRYFVLPRLELNRVTGTPRGAAHIHVRDSGTDIRIVQDARAPLPGEFILELTADHRPLTARASDQYWRWHAQLETAGRVNHPAAKCPERNGFRIRQWERQRGWSEVDVAAEQRLSGR
jgi:hypothetical protein